MAIRSVPIDPAETALGSTVDPAKIQVVGGKTQNAPVRGVFSHVQGAEHYTVGSTISGSVTLGATPKPGNLVCVAVVASGGTGLTISSIIDSHGNVYTLTPSSPSNINESTSGDSWLAYLLSAPANASATITVTFVSAVSGSVNVWADEFSVPAGTSAVFDNDAVGSGPGNAGAGVPVITPTNPTSLLYNVVATQTAVSLVHAPWTIGIIDATSGCANAYILNAGNSTALAYDLTAPGNFDSSAASFYLASTTSNYSGMALGPSGRSVIVEGVPGGSANPVYVSLKTIAPVDIVSIAGYPVAVGISGLMQVGVVGNIGAVLDGVITAATAPVNGLMTLAVNRTTAPSLTTGQSVGAQCDYQGSLFVKPYRRGQTVSQYTNIASSSAATTILAAQGTGIFADISTLIVTVTPAAATAIQFTATLSDGTKSYVYDLDTGITAATGSEGVGLNFSFNPPMPASSANTVWTLALSVATVTVNVTVVAVKQKAS